MKKCQYCNSPELTYHQYPKFLHPESKIPFMAELKVGDFKLVEAGFCPECSKWQEIEK
jgi:hypothetical protein